MMFDDALTVPAIKNIAIATDFSAWSDRAMQHAIVVARRYGAVLHILHTVRRSEFRLVPDLMVQLDELAERDCEDLMYRLRAAHSLDGIEHRCWNLSGEVSAVFADFIREHGIDLLVLGTRGRSGISKLLLGSVAEAISHCVSCPVLTVGPWSRNAPRLPILQNIMFATDLSAESISAVPYALLAARTWGSGIDVLHVCSPESSDHDQQMETYRCRLEAFACGEPQISLRFHAIAGQPSGAVLAFARENGNDLIVLGLDNSRSLYGGPALSHAYEIVRQSRCPVLSVRWHPHLAAMAAGDKAAGYESGRTGARC